MVQNMALYNTCVTVDSVYCLAFFMGGKKERPIFVLFTDVQLYENKNKYNGRDLEPRLLMYA